MGWRVSTYVWKFLRLYCTLLVFLVLTSIPGASSSTGAPHFIKEPSDTFAQKGNPALLNCLVGANTRSAISWRKNGAVLDLSSDGRITIKPNGSLYFSEVIHDKPHKSDEGTYQCEAFSSSDMGLDYQILSRTARLVVTDISSKVAVIPSKLEVPSGDAARFFCTVKQSKPKAVIRWRKQGESGFITTGGRFTLTPDGALQIRDTTFEDQGDLYECTAKNPFTATTYKSVNAGSLEITDGNNLPHGPVLSAKPQDTVAIPGSKVVLECVANGFPKPRVTWLRDGLPLVFGGDYSVLGGSNLMLESVFEEHAGTYTCRAITGVSVKQAKARLDVHYPPVFVKKPSNVHAYADSNALFECFADGIPKPNITWRRNGDMIENSDYNVIGYGFLLVKMLVLSDMGPYQCFAENSLGKIQATAELAVYEKGQPLPALHITKAPDTSTTQDVTTVSATTATPFGSTASDTIASQKTTTTNTKTIQSIKTLSDTTTASDVTTASEAMTVPSATPSSNATKEFSHTRSSPDGTAFSHTTTMSETTTIPEPSTAEDVSTAANIKVTSQTTTRLATPDTTKGPETTASSESKSPKATPTSDATESQLQNTTAWSASTANYPDTTVAADTKPSPDITTSNDAQTTLAFRKAPYTTTTSDSIETVDATMITEITTVPDITVNSDATAPEITAIVGVSTMPDTTKDPERKGGPAISTIPDVTVETPDTTGTSGTTTNSETTTAEDATAISDVTTSPIVTDGSDTTTILDVTTALDVTGISEVTENLVVTTATDTTKPPDITTSSDVTTASDATESPDVTTNLGVATAATATETLDLTTSSEVTTPLKGTQIADFTTASDVTTSSEATDTPDVTTNSGVTSASHTTETPNIPTSSDVKGASNATEIQAVKTTSDVTTASGARESPEVTTDSSVTTTVYATEIPNITTASDTKTSEATTSPDFTVTRNITTPTVAITTPDVTTIPNTEAVMHQEPEEHKTQPNKITKIVREGTEKVLKCVATASHKPIITWYRNGKKLDNTDCAALNDVRCQGIVYEVYEERRPFALQSTRGRTIQVLKIRSASYPRDQGMFECIATNGHAAPAKLIIDLDVRAPPRLMKKQDEVVSENGKNSKVTCILDKANPLPTFKWEYQNMNCPDFDTSKCQPVESHWMPVPESVIMTPKRSPANESIIRVQSDQPAARYRCKAFNKLGSDSHVIKFFRHEPLAFVGKPQNILKGYMGRKLVINCSTNYEDAVVLLLHKRHPFAAFKEKKPKENKLLKRGQVFTLLNIDLKDAGIYACKASNRAGEIIQWLVGTGYLVLSRAELPNHFVLNPMTPVNVMQGQEAKVICESEGVSITKLKWKRRTSKGNMVVADDMVTIVRNWSKNRVSATLKITNAQPEDGGVYICVLMAFDKTDYKLTTIIVKEPLAFLMQPKTLLYGYMGQNLEINCSTNDENASVSLLHRRHPFAAFTKQKLEPNRLSMKGQVFTLLNLDLRDGGRYSCEATDKANNSIRWPDGKGYLILDRARLPDYFVLKPEEPIVVLKGQDANVTCESEGVSVTKLQWRKQTISGEVTLPDNMVTHVKEMSTNRVKAILKITNAQVKDNGVYRCVAKVFEKTDYKSTKIMIEDN